MYGDCKIVINSITYDNCSNKILKGVRKQNFTEDSQTAEVVLNNSDKRFTNLNLRGLSAVISHDRGSGYTATPTLYVVTQDDITSGGNYQTILNLSGIPDLLAEDKASVDYKHNKTDTKTVKALITEVADGTAVTSNVVEQQTTQDSYYNMYYGSIIIVGQTLPILNRTVSKIGFYLKKVGSPTGDVTFYMRPADYKETVGYSWTEHKVYGDASTLSTSPAWCEITLDTPRAVDDKYVHIYCEYQDGDSSNYVAIGYNSAAVKEGEVLGLRYAEGEWHLYEDLDCAYKYTYAEDGVDCFSHCTAYTVTYDSEDSLIDSFTPGDTFKISEGESRLDVINKLLDYTACFKRYESDGEIHIFTKPASGNSYTSATKDFYRHGNRKALVIPNKIVVKSYDDDDGYEGSATSAASYALLPITGRPVRATVSSDAQADSVAAAIISRLEVNSQIGSALVYPANNEQIWNYVTVTNTWNGSTTSGNIAYISITNINGVFREFYSFGQQSKRGIIGTKPKREVQTEEFILDNANLTWGMVKNLFTVIDENTNDLYERLNYVFLLFEILGFKVDAENRDLSDNIDMLLNREVKNLKIYIDAVFERLDVTKELKIPGFRSIEGS